MNKSPDIGQLQPACEPVVDYATALNRLYDQMPELPTNAAANDSLGASVQSGNERESTLAPLTSIDELLAIDHWKPAEAQYCKAIADHYQVGKRSIQKWFVDLINLVQDIAPGVTEVDLRQSDRYTPLAVELLGHRYFAGSSKKWAIVLAEEYRDELQALQPAQSASAEDVPLLQTEVLLSAGEADRPALPPVDRDSAPRSRAAASDRTAARSLIPTGRSFLDAMGEEEQQLQDLEAQELALLGRMQQSFDRLDHHQQQWNRTSDLRRQRLLRQTRLEAAALATELEAEFNDTLHETQYRIRNGNLGKPPAANARSQPA